LRNNILYKKKMNEMIIQLPISKSDSLKCKESK
jgi:hypothetical protein